MIHIIKGSGAPQGIVPPATGVHYIDVDSENTYLSVGTDSPTQWVLQGGSASAFTNFLALLDTPASYSGNKGLVPIVNDAENALEFGGQSLVNLSDVDVTDLTDNELFVYSFDDKKFFPQYRMDWKGPWQAGSYKSNQVVNDQGWTMIANKETTERAAPQSDGDSSWSLSDNPTWQGDVANPLAIQGLRFTVGSELATIDGFRFWRSQNTGNETYAYTIQDITDPTKKTTLGSGFIPGGPVGWVEVNLEGSFFQEGQIIDIKFSTQVSTNSSAWLHTWTLQDVGGGLPASGTYTNNGDHDLLRLSILADGAVDVKSDLDDLKVGDEIVMVEANDSARFNTYIVEDTPTYNVGETVLDVPVIRIEDGKDVRIGNLAEGRATILAGQLPAPYVHLDNWWTNNPPVKGATVNGYVVTAWDEVPTLNDNAYGIDVSGHSWIQSEDWDYITTTIGAIGGSGGGGGGGSDTWLGLLDTPSTYSGQGSKLVKVKTDETGLEFSDDPTPQVEINKNALMSLSTSLLKGGGLSINAGNSSLFDQEAGLGIHVDNTTDPGNPVITRVDIPERIGVVLQNIGTQTLTLISNDKNGNIVQRATGSTPAQRRDTFDVGTIVHSDNIDIDLAINAYSPTYDTAAQLLDLMNALGFFLTGGNEIGSVAGEMQLQKAEGTGFSSGINTATDPKDPNNTVLPALNPLLFFQVKQDGVIYYQGDTINPDQYDDGGTLTTVPGSNDATIQYLYLFADNSIGILTGQEFFVNLSAALSAAGSETVIVPPILKGAILLCRLVMRKDASDTSNDARFRILPTNAVSSGGTGPDATTIQESYNVSFAPQLIVSGEGGLDNRDAATPIGSFLYRWANNDVTEIFLEVTANGVTAKALTINDVAANRALASDGSSKVVASATTASELGFLSGTSSNVQTQLDAKVPNSDKGMANGVASLDALGNVPAAQLPSYVDSVEEYATLGAFPPTGQDGKIYITLDTNRTYRWATSVYVELTDQTAVWGNISGTLANQTDLQGALDGKEPTLPLTTRGDLLVRDAANATARLPIGNNNQVLTSNGTDVSWQDGSGGGASTFDSLTDTPASKTGFAYSAPFVNGAETALEYRKVQSDLTADLNLTVNFAAGAEVPGVTYLTTQAAWDYQAQFKPDSAQTFIVTITIINCASITDMEDMRLEVLSGAWSHVTIFFPGTQVCNTAATIFTGTLFQFTNCFAPVFDGRNQSMDLDLSNRTRRFISYEGAVGRVVSQNNTTNAFVIRNATYATGGGPNDVAIRARAYSTVRLSNTWILGSNGRAASCDESQMVLSNSKLLGRETGFYADALSNVAAASGPSFDDGSTLVPDSGSVDVFIATGAVVNFVNANWSGLRDETNLLDTVNIPIPEGVLYNNDFDNLKEILDSKVDV
ncbi:MAG: hypothetical protein E2O82_03645 [Betaproteobacteria bacterium]|nr:MAG: hypothetical protein E2O82_03645 [Betaproteobacteria bacterium]